jgi:hypothetical protein
VAGTSNQVAWWENDGSMGFSTKHVVKSGFTYGRDTLIADIDADGHLDIVASSDYGVYLWFKNDGNGDFTENLISDRPGHVDDRWMQVADFDGDRQTDILTGGLADGGLVLWTNDGQGNFEEKLIDQFPGHFFVVATDLDSDGDVDAIAVSPVPSLVAWWSNDGQSNFTRQPDISTALNSPMSMQAGDMDQDGDMDLVAASGNGAEVSVLVNDGQQHFTKHVIDTYLSGGGIDQPADIDGDCDLDILGHSYNLGAVVWFENTSAPSVDTDGVCD